MHVNKESFEYSGNSGFIPRREEEALVCCDQPAQRQIELAPHADGSWLLSREPNPYAARMHRKSASQPCPQCDLKPQYSSLSSSSQNQSITLCVEVFHPQILGLETPRFGPMWQRLCLVNAKYKSTQQQLIPNIFHAVRDPNRPSTKYLRSLFPNTIWSLVFGTRNFKH